MIERRGERGSGISVLAARHDDDDDLAIGGHTLKRGVCLAIHCTIFPFLVYKDSLSVLYYCLRMCRSIIFPPSFKSWYWGMLIYFLSWNLLDMVHSYLTCCVGCICCFCFSRFGHSCLHRWLACCISECYTLDRIAHRRRRQVQFLH